MLAHSASYSHNQIIFVPDTHRHLDVLPTQRYLNARKLLFYAQDNKPFIWLEQIDVIKPISFWALPQISGPKMILGPILN